MAANRTHLGAALLALFSWGAAPAACAAGDNGFDVSIVLTDKAAAALQTRRERMVLMVEYYGWPKPEARRHADRVGRIDFGPSRMIGVPGASGTYRVPGERLPPERLAWVDGPVSVNVNVISARRSSPDNLLDCDFIDMPLAEAAGRRHGLRCGLITGDPDRPAAR